MRKKMLRVLSGVMCLILLATLVLQEPLMAATQAIPVKIGGDTFNVTPGQWVSVRSGTQVSHYNVRFVNGNPVALEMSQYTSLVFGSDAAGATAAGAASSGTSSSGSQSAQSSQVSGGGKPVGSFDSSSSSQTSQSPKVNQSSSSSQSSKPTQAAQGSSSSQPSQSTQGSNSVSGDAGSVSQSSSSTSSSQSTTTSTSDTSSTSTKSWDASKHPRDPQTGRFISHEEAIARGIMDAPDGSTTGTNVASGDAAQSGAAVKDGSAAGTDVASGDAAQSGAVNKDGSVASGDKKPSVGDKFKTGYETGKGLTNQGFQNVKDSLKSGFSAENLLVTAGITVGVDLATQIMRGEKPSAKKALKTVCSAEFVGGVSGSVLGAAAGSFFVPFLSAIPVVGGVLSALAPAFGSVAGSSMGAYLAGDLKNGKFSIKEAFKRIDWVGVTGQAIGSTAGAALGSFLGPIGTIVGGMVGGYLGNWTAQKISGFFSKGTAANLPDLTAENLGGAAIGSFAGSASVGAVAGGDVSNIAPITISGEEVLVIGDGDATVVGDYESEVALAYGKYQELYKLYNDMVNQGRQEDALAVAEAMNLAKKEYDELRGKG